MSPIGIIMAPIILACSHGVFGNTCDRDISCWSWWRMYGCYRRFNDPVQTDAYREALRRGANVRTKISVADRNPIVEFLF